MSVDIKKIVAKFFDLPLLNFPVNLKARPLQIVCQQFILTNFEKHENFLVVGKLHYSQNKK